MSGIGSGPDPYVILGVPRDADSAAIRKAYQALALQLHPDKRTGADTAELPVAGAAVSFQQLQSAWETLRDEGSRAAYVSSHCSDYTKPPHTPKASNSARVSVRRTRATSWECKLQRRT